MAAEVLGRDGHQFGVETDHDPFRRCSINRDVNEHVIYDLGLKRDPHWPRIFPEVCCDLAGVEYNHQEAPQN